MISARQLEMKKIERPTSNLPFLAGMSQKHIDLLRNVSIYAEFGSGDVIFREGSPANSFYLIDQGQVALEADMNGEGLVQIGVLKDGEPLGWSWLFPPFSWHFSARALEPTQCVVLDGGHLLVTAEENPKFGYDLMRQISQVLVERLQVTRKKMLEASETKQP